MKIFRIIVARDLKLYFAKGGGSISILVFFLIIVTLFSFATGGNEQILSEISSGIIWVCAIVTSTLSLSKIFEEDFDDGSLAQLMVQQTLPEIIIFAKIFSHWLACGLSLVLASPLIAIMLEFDMQNITSLMIALLVGTANLSLIGAIGASIAIGLKRNSSLISLLVLPLTIPTLIFGIYASENNNDEFFNNFVIIIALFMILLPISIVASCKSVKIAIED